MDKMTAPINRSFLESVSAVLAQAQKNAKTAVNLSMVYAYYEIGRMIVEEEQHGQNRAAYGKQILQELSNYLTEKFGKGFSTTNLKQMRQFYMVYSQDQIQQTLSAEFADLPTFSTGESGDKSTTPHSTLHTPHYKKGFTTFICMTKLGKQCLANSRIFPRSVPERVETSQQLHTPLSTLHTLFTLHTLTDCSRSAALC